MSSMEKVLLLANYLPQFHPIPENDEWWGKGFTEWTNTAKAKPLFRGHHQPNVPADLGFYDLRVPEAREEQAEMARRYGITGFAYWHYWFGNGNRLLERPFQEVVESGKPDYPFCLAWANQSWTGVWHGMKDKVLIEQKYPGRQDYIDHFNSLLPAFRDKRYIRIGNRPVFIVYTPDLIPDNIIFTSTWNELAAQNGLERFYFIGIHYEGWDHEKDGYDDKTIHQPSHYVRLYESSQKKRLLGMIKRNILTKQRPVTYHYRKLVENYDYSLLDSDRVIPTIVPNWDNTPRSGKRGWVFHHSSPETFSYHLDQTIRFALKREKSRPRIVFIKSWNEWAEGNYLEPDHRFGLQYLEAIRSVLDKNDIDTVY